MPIEARDLLSKVGLSALPLPLQSPSTTPSSLLVLSRYYLQPSRSSPSSPRAASPASTVLTRRPFQACVSGAIFSARAHVDTLADLTMVFAGVTLIRGRRIN